MNNSSLVMEEVDEVIDMNMTKKSTTKVKESRKSLLKTLAVL